MPPPPVGTQRRVGVHLVPHPDVVVAHVPPLVDHHPRHVHPGRVGQRRPYLVLTHRLEIVGILYPRVPRRDQDLVGVFGRVAVEDGTRDALEAEDVAHGRGGGEGFATPVEGRESVASDGSHRHIAFWYVLLG